MANQRFAPARVNGTYVFLAALAGVLLGLFAPGWYGAVILFALVAVLLVLLVTTWRTRKPAIILIRLVIIAAFVILAITKIS
jgi:predicted branched-subunit amino acid permease